MEEKAAPAAERVYRQFAQRNKQNAYIVVRIKDGFAVIEGLYAGGQKIEDAVSLSPHNIVRTSQLLPFFFSTRMLYFLS